MDIIVLVSKYDPDEGSEKVMSKTTILIQGAMEEETALLISALEDSQEIILGAWMFTKGMINDCSVVISRTRIGMTNAAASTVLAIEHFKPDYIINQGTAGGHDPNLHTRDIVLAKGIVNMTAFETPFKEQGKGIEPKEWKHMGIEVHDRKQKSWSYKKMFKTDAHLLDIASGVTYNEGKLVQGIIGSGDFWNKEIDRIYWLHETLGTSAEEMEAAAVAQIANSYEIPFLCIRILSNNEVHMEEFDVSTGEICQEFTLRVVDSLSNRL